MVNRFNGEVVVLGPGSDGRKTCLRLFRIDPDGSDDQRWAQAIAKYVLHPI